MKSNKIIIYTGLLLAGILLGWLLFGGSSKDVDDHHYDTAADNVQVWTCSMHPQIRQEQAGDCPICGMDLIPANQMEKSVDPDAIRMSKSARALAKVETVVVGGSDYSSSGQSFSGQLAINQDKVKRISINFKARVEKLYINAKGERIKKGQVIAELYAPEVQILKDEYNLAQRQDNPSLLKNITQKIENLELSLDQIKTIQKGIFQFRAPASGIITEIFINEGDNLKTDQMLMQIADLSNLWALIDIYENDLNTVTIGDELKIQVQNQEDVIGKVSFISPVLDNNTHSAKARVVLANENLELKPGVFISAELKNKKETKNQSIMIPKSALLWTGKRSVVYQQFEDESGLYYKLKEVNTGKTTEDAIEILSGISVGDIIVSHGSFAIDSEAQLADKPSMMNLKQSRSVQSKENIQLNNKYLTYYFNLKNALVNDDFQLAKSISKEYLETLMDDKSAKIGDSSIESALRDMNKNDNIEDFRKAFINLSDEVINLSQSLNTEQKMYVQYCPMANSNEGAYWLSLDESIRNPYFGEAMLTCGEVKQIIE